MHIPSLQSTNAQACVAVVFLQIFYLNVIQQRRKFFNDRLLVVAIFEKRISQNLIDESTYISKRTYFINNTNKLSGTLKNKYFLKFYRLIFSTKPDFGKETHTFFQNEKKRNKR